MKQGIILFAEAPPTPAAEKALKATVDAALRVKDAISFLAYADAAASQKLRAVVGGPPPRFFPQAARNHLGERMAQAYAYLFVQGYEQIALITAGFPAVTPEHITALLAALTDNPVYIEEASGAYAVALRRKDFPVVAPIFESLRWEAPGTKAAAEMLLLEGDS